MRDLVHLRRVSESALRHIADMLADETNPIGPDDINVEAIIVFADIEGFSDIVAREGDDVASQVLDRLDVAVEQASEHSSVRVVKQLGDGVMLTAADAYQGLLTAARLPGEFQTAMADMPFALRLRVGAHRGSVRQRGEDLIGYHVNVAARVAEQAAGGTVLVTGTLLDAVVLQDPLTSRRVGELIAKGVPERPPLFEVGIMPARSQTPPIGPMTGAA